MLMNIDPSTPRTAPSDAAAQMARRIDEAAAQMKAHPVATLAIGLVIGYVLAGVLRGR